MTSAPLRRKLKLEELCRVRVVRAMFAGAASQVENAVRGDNRAVFLDRDGTLIRNHHYGCDPKGIELLDGVVEGLRELQLAGFRLVIVTNQSGIARGYFDEQQLVAMHDELTAVLAKHGVHLAGIYYCPHHPEGTLPQFVKDCGCRKPRPGMLLRASVELGIDLAASWMVGDILHDVAAGNAVGCRSILVDVGTEGSPEDALSTPLYVSSGFRDAARFIIANSAPVVSIVRVVGEGK